MPIRAFFQRHPVVTLLAVAFIGLQASFSVTWVYSLFRERLVAAEGIRDTIFYQGKIATTNNIPPASGNYNMQFLVYSAQTAGTLLWTETWDGSSQGAGASKVNINNGVFSVELNSLCGNWQGACATNGGVDFNNDSLWLEVRFDPDGDTVYQEIFTPRKRLTAIPYALNADRVDGKDIGTSGSALPLLDGTNTWSARQTFTAPTLSTVPVVISGSTGQTAALQQWKSSTGAVLASISPSGALSVASFATGRITSPVSGSAGMAPANEASTVAYWSFDEGGGTTAADTSGNDLLMTFSDAPAWDAGYFGYSGDYGATFNGTQSATANDAAYLDGGAALSIEFWVKTTDTGTSGIVNKFNAANPDAGDDAYQVKVAAGQVQVILASGAVQTTVAASATTINDGEWHQVVYTFARPTSALYIDGVYDSAASYAPFDYVINDSTDPLIIGALKTNDLLSSHFTGSLDTLIIYNAALSANVVAAHHADSGPTSTALTLDTAGAISGEGAKLLSVRNNGTEKASISADGQISAAGALLTLTTDTRGLVITASASQTANLLELRDSEGGIVTAFSPAGAFSAAQLTSSVTETIGAPAVDNGAQRGYWRFNEGTDTTAADATAAGRSATLQSSAWTGSGYFSADPENSVTLDGAAGYVSVPHHADLNPGTGSFSVESWVRPTAYTTDGAGWTEAVAVKADGDFSNGYALLADGTGGLPAFSVADASANTAAAIGAARLSLNEWHHLVGTWDSSTKTAKLYVDGAAAGTDTDATVGEVNPSADLIFGRYYRGSQARYEYFTGQIDNPILWNSALGAATVSQHYQSAAGASAALVIDTASTFAGAQSRLLSIRNNGTEKVGITAQGGITSTGQFLLNLGSDVAGMLIYGSSGQTADLQRWYSPSRSLYTSVNSMGLINAPALTSGAFYVPGAGVTAAPDVLPQMTAYWKLDENTGTSLVDATGNGHTALAGDPAWVSGQYGYSGDGAVGFNGSTAAIATDITISGPFALELWFNAATISGDQDIVAQVDGGESAPLLRINIGGVTANALTYRLYDDTGTPHDLTARVDAGTWHHLAALWDGSSQQLFIDGQRVGTAAVGAIAGSQTSTLTFGKRGAVDAGYYSGSLDGLIVFSEAPGADTIAARYLAGRAMTGTVLASTADMTGGTLLDIQNQGQRVATVAASGNFTLRLAEDTIGIIVRAAPGQTADLQQWQDAAGTAKAGVTAAGTGYFTGIQTAGRFVGKRTQVILPSYTITADDYIVEVNYTSGGVTLYLPSAVGIEGQIYTIKDAGGTAAANPITVTPDGSETIDGNSTGSVTADYGTLTIYSNGANWLILN